MAKKAKAARKKQVQAPETKSFGLRPPTPEDLAYARAAVLEEMGLSEANLNPSPSLWVYPLGLAVIGLGVWMGKREAA